MKYSKKLQASARKVAMLHEVSAKVCLKCSLLCECCNVEMCTNIPIIGCDDDSNKENVVLLNLILKDREEDREPAEKKEKE